jgi:hypothetical protein
VKLLITVKFLQYYGIAYHRKFFALPEFPFFRLQMSLILGGS